MGGWGGEWKGYEHIQIWHKLRRSNGCQQTNCTVHVPLLSSQAIDRQDAAFDNVQYTVCLLGGQAKLPELSHQKEPEETLGIKDQGCPVLRLSHKMVWWRT